MKTLIWGLKGYLGSLVSKPEPLGPNSRFPCGHAQTGDIYLFFLNMHIWITHQRITVRYLLYLYGSVFKTVKNVLTTLKWPTVANSFLLNRQEFEYCTCQRYCVRHLYFVYMSLLLGEIFFTLLTIVTIDKVYQIKNKTLAD